MRIVMTGVVHAHIHNELVVGSSHVLTNFCSCALSDGPLLEVQDWKGPIVEDGGKNPKWSADDPKNTAEV